MMFEVSFDGEEPKLFVGRLSTLLIEVVDYSKKNKTELKQIREIY